MKRQYNIQNPTALISQGIKHLQELAGDTWTDHNTHDPGITILEHLSFALADLNYRTSFDVKDIITRPFGDKEDAHQFFTAREILTGNPVTTDDYRKLIIDVEGIRNAWVVPTKQPEVIYKNKTRTALSHYSDKVVADAPDTLQLTGLYTVLLEFEEENLGKEGISLIEQHVHEHLMNHRNIGEDFLGFETIKTEEIAIAAEIELEIEASVDETLTNIYHKLYNFLTPPLRFYSLDELLDMEISADEIFEGPALDNGFLLTEELPVHRTSIHTSDVVQLIMDVKGVKAVRNFHASNHPEGVLFRGGQRWCVKLNPDLNYTPRLVPSKCDMVFYKNGMAYIADTANVDRLFNVKRQNDINRQYPAHPKTDIDIPGGRYRNLHEYFSVQHDFPQNYGIGKAGLPSTASPKRRAQAKQLKAYLLLFEQLMANYQAQLANAGSLLSNDFSDLQTYFYQLPQVTGVAELYSGDPSPEQGDKDDGQRTIRFINHKLGRFAEQVSEHALLSYGLKGDKAVAEEIADKLALLKEYPSISSARGTGFNYTAKQINTGNVSGLKKRVCRLLGINDYNCKELAGLTGKNGEGFHILEHLLLRPRIPENEITESKEKFLDIFPTSEHHSSPWKEDPYSHIVSVIAPNWPGKFSAKNKKFRQHFENTLQLESPSHVLIHVHWLNKAAMKSFEKSYFNWLKNGYTATLNILIEEVNLLYRNRTTYQIPLKFPEDRTIELNASKKNIAVEIASLNFTMGKGYRAEAGLVIDWKDENTYRLFYYSQIEKKVILAQMESGIRNTILSTPVTDLSGADMEMSLQLYQGRLRCKQRSPNSIGTEFLLSDIHVLDGMKIGLYTHNTRTARFHRLKVTDEITSTLIPIAVSG